MKRQQDLLDIWSDDNIVTHRVKRIYENATVDEPIWDATDEEAEEYGRTYFPTALKVEIYRYTGVNERGLFITKKIKEIKK